MIGDNIYYRSRHIFDNDISMLTEDIISICRKVATNSGIRFLWKAPYIVITRVLSQMLFVNFQFERNCSGIQIEVQKGPKTHLHIRDKNLVWPTPGRAWWCL